jgi:lipoprotein-anchoring transpeptidase ErfK/SrfK
MLTKVFSKDFGSAMLEKIKTFLEQIHYIGFSNFDIKYDNRDEKYKVFEINLRQGRSNFYVTGSGHNLAKYIVEDYIENKELPLDMVKERKLWLVIPKMVVLKYTKSEKLKSEKNIAKSTKKIVVKLSEQRLYAYDNDEKFMDVPISSGLNDLPTPIGTFNIFSKTPSRYMQGPLPGVSDQEYDLPGVPWTMYFTHSGAAIHGAYWHNNFGEQWSHGCINLIPADAEILYAWADAGTEVTVEK